MRKGHLLNERYKIKTKIGSGGMADVFLARDVILERDVAVKALRMEYANDQEFIARFDREAQSATSLSHPNIVSIYDVGEEDHLLYMVMEYIDGMTLKEYIQSYGPLGVQESLDIIKQITSAIAHAHANELVHRDIKPQNILINNFGQVKVTDFGIAIALSATALTQTNSILGSVHYLSPEQARGGMATKKSDIYSLGIVLFEMLTGRLPFSGQSPVSIALKHLQSETPSVRRFNQDIPQSVENIVLKATAKDPFHRYETIYDLEDAIETALHPDKINEAPYTPPIEVGEETKAIPIITDNQMNNDYNQETLVHHTNGVTKNYPEDNLEDGQPSTNTNEGKKKKNKKVKKQKKTKKRKWPIIVSVILLLLVAGIVALFAIPGILQPKEVTIPSEIIEMEADEAADLLEDLKLVVEEEEIPSEEIEEGFVVRTEPRAGRTVKEESTVTLYVSSGKEKIEFGDYEGQDYSQVKHKLEIEGFTDFYPREEYSDESEGEIITQISPSPGSLVVPSETRVSFVVSKGPEPIELNNLANMLEEDAKSYLEENNLQMNKETKHSDSVAEGRVISHSPATGTKLQTGDTVNVIISRGPEELPPMNKTITVPIPYDPPEQEVSDGENGEQQENQEPIEQVVQVYIDDMNHDFSVPAEDYGKTITSDDEVSFTLTIAPDSSARYRVTRDGETIEEETIEYKEGE
ncbi:Stk1 family PASTA domain-containing Ser/Thr kinase [Oceanobacillus halophilus]|uniref:Serine/threonine-protein kinase PrkC n=1 Tax=Oceanobacillus halophilus TaxID=930130 RepID=A0A495ABQ8_9BACI|nr:Stk1 family PASTA domain-containing Ser/Thr kinase [Oceanobacillus halophilus]RKQ37436.1 Stk1 family PASTA domain-containing Ser/Thr kinase [Oceanobacillus halophilus]